MVQRQRLPRGRTSKIGANRKDLRERVRKLESIISALAHRIPGSLHDKAEPASASSTQMASFVGSEFWEELTGTIAGMRQVLEGSDISGEELGAVIHSDSSEVELCQLPERLVLFGADPSTTLIPQIPDTSPWLLSIYHSRVHTIFRLLHWPSTLASLESDSRTASLVALQSSISFTSVCTLMEHEVENRQSMIQYHRLKAEAALANASLLSTTSLTTVQAFVIYLAGLRACQANSQQWTLTATAIRIASALGIPASFRADRWNKQEDLRRRLWCCIGLLDLQSAFDRGSRPLLASSEIQMLPLNVNDEEAIMQSNVLSHTADRFTGMSFSLLMYQGGICQRRLTEIGLAAASGSIDPAAARAEQFTVLDQFRQEVDNVSKLCDTPPTTIQAFTRSVGKESLVAMRLLLHRPLHHRGRMPALSHHGSPSGFSVLATATEVLERSQSKRTEQCFAQWAWFSWVKWYALAIVLAELCATSNSSHDHSWQVAQRSYEDYATIVADTKTGLLWKPIERLMSKVKQLRGEGSLVERTSAEAARGHRTQPGLDSQVSPLNQTEDIGHDLSQIDLGGFDQTMEDASWIYWEMLIEDINNQGIIAHETFQMTESDS